MAKRDPYWPAQLAVALVVALHFTLAHKLLIGPSWLLPSIEAVLLAALIIITPQKHAPAKDHWHRTLALAITGFVSVVNVIALAIIVHRLVNGGGNIPGHRLIASGVLIWATTVLIFAVWYWEMDRRDPDNPLPPNTPPHFMFSRMGSDFEMGFQPRFGDYLYLSLTNSVAFSPTDTLPLRLGAKAVMGLQSLAALTTIGLVIARAVNILG